MLDRRDEGEGPLNLSTMRFGGSRWEMADPITATESLYCST